MARSTHYPSPQSSEICLRQKNLSCKCVCECNSKCKYKSWEEEHERCHLGNQEEVLVDVLWDIVHEEEMLDSYFSLFHVKTQTTHTSEDEHEDVHGHHGGPQ